jgi:multimeric flavodoxin WrbA
MKALILDGSPNGEGEMHRVRDILTNELAGMGWDVAPITLHDLKIHYCTGCFGCWVQTPGKCMINDAARDIAPAVMQSDMVVYLTPITFGGYSSELKKALDRMICLVTPFFTKIDGEVHHKPRYERYPQLMGVGVSPQADKESERIFETLVRRNALNMHAPAHAAGVVYRNQEANEIQDEIRALLNKVEVRE